MFHAFIRYNISLISCSLYSVQVLWLSKIYILLKNSSIQADLTIAIQNTNILRSITTTDSWEFPEIFSDIHVLILPLIAPKFRFIDMSNVPKQLEVLLHCMAILIRLPINLYRVETGKVEQRLLLIKGIDHSYHHRFRVVGKRHKESVQEKRHMPIV